MKYDVILVNGDSYSARTNGPVWADHLSQAYQKPLYNIAFPGSNNRRIVRSTIEWCLKLQQQGLDPLVIVGWSFIRRQEVWHYGEIDKIKHLLPDCVDNEHTRLITLDALLNNNEATPEQKAMVPDVQHIHKALIDFWTDVWLLSTVLDSKQIPYWFFSAARNTDCPVNCFPYIENLSLVSECIANKNIWKINEFCIQDWAQLNDSFADAITGHLSTTGHIKFAEMLQEYINNLC